MINTYSQNKVSSEKVIFPIIANLQKISNIFIRKKNQFKSMLFKGQLYYATECQVLS